MGSPGVGCRELVGRRVVIWTPSASSAQAGTLLCACHAQKRSNKHPWEQSVGDFLTERRLDSTEFDSAFGTIGGGNHFAELQAVEKVLDPDEFKKIGLGKQQLVVLVHSGSRGLGESVLHHHVDRYVANGVEAESFAAGEYLCGHDFATRWAKGSVARDACDGIVRPTARGTSRGGPPGR